MKNQSKVQLAMLCAVPFVMVLGNSMLIPVLPDMQKALGISHLQVSLVITAFSISAGLIIPLTGYLSDRLDRKKIIVPSLILYGLGGVIAIAAIWLLPKPYLLIMVGRVIQGIGAAGTAPIAMALSSDIFTSRERSKALGFIEASNGFGKIMSPILGAAIGLIIWYAAFFVFPALCIPIAIGVWFLVKDPNANQPKKASAAYFQSLLKIFRKKCAFLLASFFGGSVALFTLFGVLFFMSDYLEGRYKVDGVLKGLILAIPVLAMATTSFLTGVYVQKSQKLMKPIMVIGFILLGGSLLAAVFFRQVYILIILLVVAGIGTGSVLPCLNTMITSVCTNEERGMVTSLYGMVRFFGVAIGPPVFGLLMELGQGWMFGTVAGLAFFTVVIVTIFVKPGKNIVASQVAGAKTKGPVLWPQPARKPKQKP